MYVYYFFSLIWVQDIFDNLAQTKPSLFQIDKDIPTYVCIFLIAHKCLSGFQLLYSYHYAIETVIFLFIYLDRSEDRTCIDKVSKIYILKLNDDERLKLKKRDY